MRAWIFQDAKQLAKHGDRCPWSVGWYDRDGKRRGQKAGSKSNAEKLRRKIEGELAAGLTAGPKRYRWTDLREKFAAVVSSTKAAKTAAAYDAAFDSFERIAAPVFVDAITAETFDTFAAKRSAEFARTPVARKANSKSPEREPRRVSPATVNMELRHVKAALRKAEQWGWIARAPRVAMLREPQRDPYFIDDTAFAALYSACDTMTRPDGNAADWWRALLAFAYMTGWRIGEILSLRWTDVDLETGVATVDADNTKGRRTARVELAPVVVAHLAAIRGFGPLVFAWPYHERTLWTDFKALKTAAGVAFPGAFHRLRFGFANANVDALPADVLQQLMRHKSAATTRHYVNAAARMRRSGVADKLHVPPVLATGR